MKQFFKLKLLMTLTAMMVIIMAALCYISINELDYSLLDKRSRVLYAADGSVIGYSLSEDSDAYRFYTRVDEVSPLYIQMLLVNEDKNFYHHCGVDFLSLIRATFSNLRSGRITSGGSTIAMQVVKKLTGHERTYFNKLKEIIQAIYITKKFGREKVLEWYLTIAPYGSNIEGVKAASLRWFNHLPDKMTPSEAALLTALPRAPEYIRPDRNHKATLYYKNEVLKNSYGKMVFSDDVWKASLKDEIPDRLHPIVKSESTLAAYLFSRTADREIYSYIDPKIQEILQNQAGIFHENHQDGAVLSAVVLDASSHRITGVLGSSDLQVTQMCLPLYRRSPGSSLKPFAYGMAFNEGKLHPRTILHDNTRLYGSWKPSNFTNRFMGKVSADKALTLSLNLPALEVLNLIGPHNFLSTLNKNRQRVYVRNNAADYSIVLGSADINLVDLAELYAMLNEDGVLHSYALTVDPEKRNDEAVKMMSPESARAVFEILKDTPRPPNGINMENVSYKTGTSSRYVDALATGSLGNYTVAVAVRFPDNRAGYYKYSGLKDAAPVLFAILNELPVKNFEKRELSSELFDSVAPEGLAETVEDNKIIDDKSLQIVFPKNGDTVLPDYNGNIFIKYTGGEGKIYLNYEDVQSENDYFHPEREGFYSISILDEAGHSDTVNFRVVLDE